MSHNRNPEGKNQWGNTPTLENTTFVDALKQYHREGKTSNANIKQLLLNEHGIDVSISTIKRRREDLGLFGSRSKKQKLSEQEIEQIVLNQVDSDVAKNLGKASIKARIAHDQNIHIPRDKVAEVMHMHEPEGFAKRHPTSKRIHRAPIISIGVHEQWSGDGHDKLYGIGFPIWAVADVASKSILGAWVLPSNRDGTTIGYIFLTLVLKFKGLPIQFGSDCGTETTQLFGLVQALREMFFEELSTTEIRAYRYSRSVHNIVIERSWGRLRLDFGISCVEAFAQGELRGDYNPEGPQQRDLCQWLWAKLIQAELDQWASYRNAFKSRKDPKKAGPSGVSPNDIVAMPHEYGLQNCLLRLTEEQLQIVEEVKDFMEGDAKLDFVSEDFAAEAQAAYDAEGVHKLTMQNIWSVFTSLRTRLGI